MLAAPSGGSMLGRGRMGRRRMDETGRIAPHVHADPGGTAWSLHWHGSRLDVRVQDGALVCDY